jgi:hypothetical protein
MRIHFIYLNTNLRWSEAGNELFKLLGLLHFTLINQSVSSKLDGDIICSDLLLANFDLPKHSCSP